MSILVYKDINFKILKIVVKQLPPINLHNIKIYYVEQPIKC